MYYVQIQAKQESLQANQESLQFKHKDLSCKFLELDDIYIRCPSVMFFYSFFDGEFDLT